MHAKNCWPPGGLGVSGKKIEGVMNRWRSFTPLLGTMSNGNVDIPFTVKEAIVEGRIGSADHKPKRSRRTGYAPTVEDVDDDDDDDDMTGEFRKTARDLMWENGGPGVWAPDYRELYDLKDEVWKVPCHS